MSIIYDNTAIRYVRIFDGRTYGWLAIPEFDDAILVRKISHKMGYSLAFMAPENYGPSNSDKNLSNSGLGLYFWKSLAQVKEVPKSAIFYWGDDSNFEAKSGNAIMVSL